MERDFGTLIGAAAFLLDEARHGARLMTTALMP